MKVVGKVFEPLSEHSGEVDAHIGQRLREFRLLSGLTQAEVAERLNVCQSAVTRLEGRRDILISTLREYLAVMGASLRVNAHFDSSAAMVSSLREADFRFDPVDENQLVFSIIGEDVLPPQRDIVFSIKPEFSRKIVAGEKTVELRRRFPLSIPAGTTALIYETSPTRALTGIAEIGQVYRQSPKDIWTSFADQACIARKDFDSYFDGVEAGFVIEMKHARALRRPLDLSELRDRFKFEPPQSYLYATQKMREALRYECAQLPN